MYQYRTQIHLIPEKGGAYVEFPYDIRTEFGKGRVKVYVTFDGIPYDGSIVNMGIKNANGDVCYIGPKYKNCFMEVINYDTVSK